VGGRSTAVKLKSGGVWILASTPLSTETKAKLDELGPVKSVPSSYAPKLSNRDFILDIYVVLILSIGSSSVRPSASNLRTCCELNVYSAEFKKAYPQAKLYSVEEAVSNKVDKNLKFDGGAWSNRICSTGVC
jgi:hypothetical protein